jgi:hypothetical protein
MKWLEQTEMRVALVRKKVFWISIQIRGANA